MSADETRLQALLARLDTMSGRLEGMGDDADALRQAVTELDQVAHQVIAEIDRQRQELRPDD